MADPFKILTSTVEANIDDFITDSNVDADFPEGGSTTTLDDTKKHTTDEVWWVYSQSCVDNGGLGKAAIQARLDAALLVPENGEENLTMQKLYDDGWLPIVEGD